jgi:hypothetical protein
MQSVPNYQIIDFLDWLKYNQKNVELESYELRKLAENYLRDFAFYRGKLDIRLILKAFQVCHHSHESSIINGMKHFSQCGKCFHYLKEKDYFWNLKELKLHPLLEEFLFFLDERDFYIDEFENIGINDDNISDRLPYVFRDWIRRNGDKLFFNFRKFIEKIDENLLNDFDKQIRQNREYKYSKNRESFNGELSIEKYGIESEAYRLADSVRYLFDRNQQNPKLLSLYSSIFKDEFAKTIEFFNWIKYNYPKVNLASDIPYNKLDELIDQFCEERSYSEIKTFKKQVERTFRGELDKNLLNRISNWLIGSKVQINNQTNPFDRYSQMNFHGIFLFPNFGSSDLVDFIDKAWQDLNSLTGEWIDIYYSKEDIKKRNGFDILNDFKSFNNIKLTDLPAFILWDKSLNNALALPLRKLDNEQILMTIKQIVQSIKEGGDLQRVAKAGLAVINKELKKYIFFKQKIINVMGDNYELKNIKGSTVIIKSKVENSFNKVKDQLGEETANVIKQIAEIVEKSKNAEARDLFDAFNEEINKPEPKKSILKSFWDGLSKVLPILASTASIVEKIMKIVS